MEKCSRKYRGERNCFGLLNSSFTEHLHKMEKWIFTMAKVNFAEKIKGNIIETLLFESQYKLFGSCFYSSFSLDNINDTAYSRG